MPFSIENENEYVDYLGRQGVGRNETIKGVSTSTYISDLKAAAKILNCDISAQLFPNMNESDLKNVCCRIRQNQEYAQYAIGSRENAVTAMRHYFNFVMENR